MSNRESVAAASIAIVAVVALVSVPLAGQGQAQRKAQQNPVAKPAAWKMPRTVDGHPDLQGFWTNQTVTPLERPRGVTKEFYTAEEYAEIEKREAARLSEQGDAPDSAGEWLRLGPGATPIPGSLADVHYDFSQFGLDRSQSAIGKTMRTSQVIDPADGRVPPLSDAGRRRADARAKETASRGGGLDRAQNVGGLDDRCLIMGVGPPMTPRGYNSNLQIVQNKENVMILVEMIHDARVIPTNGRPQVPTNVRQWTGSSRGRWEGDTLVVETTNFNDKVPFRGSSPNMRVTERFTRVSDDTVLYRFTIDDPDTWTKPWTAEIPLTKTVGPLFEHACHEGNYAMVNALSGARAEEKRAAEAAAKKASSPQK